MSVRKGDIGVDLIITMLKSSDKTPLDVSAASVMQIKLRPFGGSTKTKTATHVTDGTDGKIHYVTAEASDLDVGNVNWEIQSFVSAPTFIGHSDKSAFHVEEIL